MIAATLVLLVLVALLTGFMVAVMGWRVAALFTGTVSVFVLFVYCLISFLYDFLLS